MSVFRVILSIIFPPLAVLDKGCGSFLIVTILTCAGWIPGVIGALVILNKDTETPRYNQPTYPTYPTYPTNPTNPANPRRSGWEY